MASEWLKSEKNMYRTTQTFAAVPADSSMTRTVVPIQTFGGRIRQVAVHTANAVKFDFSLFQNAASLSTTVDEIYRMIGATQFWQKTEHDIRFENSDTPQATSLFLEFTNTNTIIPSGVITLQLYIQAPGTGGV